MRICSVCSVIPLLQGIYSFSFVSTVPRNVHRARKTTPLFAGKEGLVRITDVEAEIISSKLQETIIDFPKVPNFMEKALIGQVLKAILEAGPLVVPEEDFNRLVAGEMVLNEKLVREINDKIDIPILSTSAQNEMVEKICLIMFSPTAFKKVKRQMLSRVTRDLMYKDSRLVLASKLRDKFDLPFIPDEKELSVAEAIVNKCYGILEKYLSPDILDLLETASPEELYSIRENLVSRLSGRFDLPFVSDEIEEEVIYFVIDFWLNFYGLEDATKRADEKIIETEHKLRAVEIELEALMDVTHHKIDDLRTNRDALRSRLVEMTRTYCPPPANVENVVILKDADSVGQHIREIVAEEAESAISRRGHFALAIPGGSILKMLAGGDFKEESWMSKTTIFYVNHKCVSMEDPELATHAKANKLFLNEWTGVNVITLGGTSDGEKEATYYEEQMLSLDEGILPIDPEYGLPVFDLSLIGVGDDGHIGSLYPGRDEVLSGVYGPWVLPVAMKDPPSITLSLPVMKGRKTIVAACGVSDKYPQGKADGMRRAIAADDETVTTFPAVGLRDCSVWVLDEMAASKLGDNYE